MTISTADREAGPFNCDGVDTTFEFDFKVFAAADLKVIYKPDSGAEQTLVLNTNYTVALNADQDDNPGGVVTTTGPNSPYDNGTITVTSDIAEVQNSELPNAGAWFPKVVENALDRLTVIAQQLRGILNRSLRQPISDATRLSELPPAAERAGKALIFDVNGDVAVSTDDFNDSAEAAAVSASSAASAAVAAANAQAAAELAAGKIPNPSGAPDAGKILRVVSPGGTTYELTPLPGGGDVVGPAGATSNGFARFSGTTGKVLQDGGTAILASDIPADAVSFAKMQNITTDRLIGRDTATTGDPEEISVSGGIEFTGAGGVRTSAFTGDVTKTAGGTALTIAPSAVTYAKMQNVSATDRLLGRSTAGAGVVEEITCTAAARALLDDPDAGTMRATLGVVSSSAPANLGPTAQNGASTQAAKSDHVHQYPLEAIQIAVSDETTALTIGTAKITFRMPYAFTLTGVRGSLSTGQTGGSIFTVDINEGGVSILSTKLTIDNGEKTSVTAAAAAVISDTALADDAEITIDIDQVGDGTAKGLKVTLIGRKAA